MSNDKNICRLCMEDLEDHKINILEKDLIGLMDKIEQFTGVKILVEETTRICSVCTRKILDFDEFVEKCREVDSVLCRTVKKEERSSIAINKSSNRNNNQKRINEQNPNNSQNNPENLHLRNDLVRFIKREPGTIILKVDNYIKSSPNENFKCTMCDSQFATFSEYQIHFKEHDSKLEKDVPEKHKIACRICNYSILPKNMASHLIIHTDVYKCKKCGVRHSSRYLLEKHLKTRHADVSNYICHICGMKTSSLLTMNRHVACHKVSNGPFKCKYCKFNAKTRAALKVHLKQHLEKPNTRGGKPLKVLDHDRRIDRRNICVCSVCIKENNASKMPKIKMKRLNTCTTCNKKFLTKRGLKRHMIYHRNPLTCQSCGRNFPYKRLLNKHKCLTPPPPNEPLAESDSKCNVQEE